MLILNEFSYPAFSSGLNIQDNFSFKKDRHAALEKSIVVKIQQEGLDVSNKKVKLNAFIKGGEIANLYYETLPANCKTFEINYKLTDSRYKGIGEVVIEGVGAFPVIIGDSNAIINLKEENLKKYLVPNSTSELKVLGEFMTIYRGYENMFSHYQPYLISPYGKYTSDSTVYDKILRDYQAFRKQFNLFFKYATQNYPNTYVSETLSKLFVQTEAINSWSDVRSEYFKSWDFTDINLMNNPLFNRQLDIYYKLGDMPTMKGDIENIDALYENVLASNASSKVISDHINEYTVIRLFGLNKTGNKNNVLEHLYKQWLSKQLDNCNEEAEASNDAVFQAAFYKRLENINKVNEGARLPEVLGFDKVGNRISTTTLINKSSKKPFTILFLWSSTCSHCEEYAPQLQEFANLNKDKVQVVAYSIDKKNNEQNWLKNISKRKLINNWIDIAEINDMQSIGISKICYMGTPSLFLLDENSTIISKITDLKVLTQIINSKN